MLGINGIGAAGGTAEPRPTQGGASKPAPAGPRVADGVAFSETATTASQATQLVQESQEAAQNVERQQRIEEAKRNIEQGAHRINSIVLEVAGRITGYVG